MALNIHEYRFLPEPFCQESTRNPRQACQTEVNCVLQPRERTLSLSLAPSEPLGTALDGTSLGNPLLPPCPSPFLPFLMVADQKPLAAAAHAASDHHTQSQQNRSRVGNHCSRNWLS